MTLSDLQYLDLHKGNDKEWYLLRNEPNVEIKTMDHIKGIPPEIRETLNRIKNEPLKSDALRVYNRCVKVITSGLSNDTMEIV